jgi:hypothetical protein
MNYTDIVKCRRALQISGYKTLADVGFDWETVTPYQKASCSPDGPVLVAHHWLDVDSVDKYRTILDEFGYLPSMAFNKVINHALALCSMRREQLYVTQAFHLLPLGGDRCAQIPGKHIDRNFEAVTQHELTGRRVIALGVPAANACERHGIKYDFAPHPSARGLSHESKAKELARLLIANC